MTVPGYATFAIIYEMDEDDDWHDPKVWAKVNPSTPYVDTLMDFVKEQYEKAVERGGVDLVNSFIKNLNKWQTVGENWIKPDEWKNSTETFDLSLLDGRQVYCGLDLANTRDLSALCILAPPIDPEDEDEPFLIRWLYWIPKEEAETRANLDGLPYNEWADDGFITLTQGNVRDGKQIVHDIVTEVADKYNVVEIAYDRWMSTEIIVDLQEKGAPMLPFGQGYASMSAPTKRMAELVLEKRLWHNHNPVSAWQVGNIVIDMDPAGSIKITRNKCKEKVDGMVALVMAIGAYLGQYKDNSNKSVYDERGIRTI